MKQLKLKVSFREETGKGVVRRLRKEGRIPGVIYGESGSSSLSIQDTDFRDLMRTMGDSTALIEIKDDQGKKHLSVLQDVQRDNCTDRFVHVDFHEVSQKKEMHASLPVHVKGDAFGVKNEGGLIDFVNHTVEVVCLPKNLPEYIEVDVTDLHVGHAIHIADLPKLEGVKFPQNDEVVVIACVGAKIKEPVESEAEAAEEASDSEEATESKE